jgi:hypothetical protein
MKTIKVTRIVTLLMILTTPTLAENYTIRDKNYTTQGYVKDGKIYDRNYKIEGYVTKDGAIRDRDYNVKGYVDRNNKGYGGHNSGHRK